MREKRVNEIEGKEKRIQKLPEAELDVMLVIWKLNRPAKIIDIFEGLKQVHPLSKSAIHTLVDNLLKREFIKIEYSPDKQSYKMISPLVSEEEYRAVEADSFVSKLCRGKWQNLITALVDTNEISDEDLEELTSLLNKKGE